MYECCEVVAVVSAMHCYPRGILETSSILIMTDVHGIHCIRRVLLQHLPFHYITKILLQPRWVKIYYGIVDTQGRNFTCHKMCGSNKIDKMHSTKIMFWLETFRICWSWRNYAKFLYFYEAIYGLFMVSDAMKVTLVTVWVKAVAHKVQNRAVCHHKFWTATSIIYNDLFDIRPTWPTFNETAPGNILKQVLIK